jgi:N4-gp56 family major capsid protein
MATQTYAALTAEQRTFYVRALLERLSPNLAHDKGAREDSVDKNSGLTVNWRYIAPLAAATTPLTEGVTPAGSALSITASTASLSQYGDFVEYSDVLDLAGIDPVATELVELLGEQAGLTIDTVIRDVVAAGTGVQYAAGRTSRATIASTDIMTATEIRKAVRTLRAANVKPFAGGDYYGIVHPNTAFDIQGDTLFVNVKLYGRPEDIEAGELGRLWGVRFFQTSNAKVFAGAGAGGIDVYATLIYGQGYFGAVDIRGSRKPEVLIKQLGSAGTADPLSQRATVGWKCMFATKRLNESCCVRIEHAVSA